MEPQLSFREHLGEIREIMGLVFSTMLQMEVKPVPGAWQKSDRSVTAAIYFAGPWKGAAMLECSREAAFLFTRILGDGPEPYDVDEAVRDVLGELANTVGGNLKAILPKGVSLSMPIVVEGTDYVIWFSGGNIVSRMAFASEAGTVWLHLIEVPAKSVPEEVISLA